MADKLRKVVSLPINVTFRLPLSLPDWPPGNGFAAGTIDLGEGFQVRQISEFQRIWYTDEGGSGGLGVSFFEPHEIPAGFCMLGCYCQPNHRALHGCVLVGKDSSGDILMEPVDYSLIWSSKRGKQIGCIWEPVPPQGYLPVGYVVSDFPEKPPLSKIRCVRRDFTERCELDEWLCGSDRNLFDCCYSGYGRWDVFSLKPKIRGLGSAGVSVGTFAIRIPQEDGEEIPLHCIANRSLSFSCLPNTNQIAALLGTYAPFVHLHPDEKYLPSSVDWYVKNCLLVHPEGKQSISAAGDLPKNHPEMHSLCLEFPSEIADKVKKGSMEEAQVYINVKAMLGATFTDVVFWFFYPFNGPGRISLFGKDWQFRRTGQHVGDWEHMTLRISNFNGELQKVYFSQHSAGIWMDASQLEYAEGSNRVVGYSSLNGHAMFPKEGRNLQGAAGMGAVDCCARSGVVLDCAERGVLVAARHLPEHSESQWLEYSGRWGPTVQYTLGRWVTMVESSLPWKLGSAFRKMVFLPNEMLEEDTPRGPKTKDCWLGDERVKLRTPKK